MGCDPEQIKIDQIRFADCLTVEDCPPKTDPPHMWTLGWGPDYADENNWVGDVLWAVLLAVLWAVLLAELLAVLLAAMWAVQLAAMWAVLLAPPPVRV